MKLKRVPAPMELEKLQEMAEERVTDLDQEDTPTDSYLEMLSRPKPGEPHWKLRRREEQGPPVEAVVDQEFETVCRLNEAYATGAKQLPYRQRVLQSISVAAERHGMDSSDLDHQIGDLEDALSLAFDYLSEEQVSMVLVELREDSNWLDREMAGDE